MDSQYSRISEAILMPLRPGPTIESLYSQLLGSRGHPGELVPVIENNPLYHHLLQRLVISKLQKSKWADDAPIKPPSSEKISHLLGFSGVRNQMLAFRLSRLFHQKFDDGDPTKILKRTFEVESIFQQHRMGRLPYAIHGAIVFDWIEQSLLLEDQAKARVLRESLRVAWQDALEIGLLAYWIGAPVSGFVLQPYCFAAAACIQAGGLLMERICLEESENPYSQFLSKKPPLLKSESYEILQLEENSKFLINHAELASLIALTYTPLKKVHRAIHHYIKPYYLRKDRPDDFRLAVALITARGIKDTMDPRRLSKENLRWAKECGFKERDLITAYGKTKKILRK